MKAQFKSRFLSIVLTTLFCLLANSYTHAQTFLTLRNLATADGTMPQAALVATNGSLYGVSALGGSLSQGTIYRINEDGSGFTVLHNFSLLQGTNSTNIDGAAPQAGLLLYSNILFGTTTLGGTNGAGTIFSLNTNGTGFTTLHHFSLPSGSLFTNKDGANPAASLIAAGGTLYGTAANGGATGSGTLFSINTNGSGFAVMHNFSAMGNVFPFANSDGAGPVASLTFSTNTLYGVASVGGAQGNGTVFKINTNGTLFTTLHSFSGLSTGSINGEGANPFGALVLANNILYGTATNGGTAGKGTIFCVTTDGIGFTNVHNFIEATDGSHPLAGLTLTSNLFYGTASQGGQFTSGTLFSMNLDGTGFTNVYTFSARSSGANGDGAFPEASLLFDNGNFYGTSQLGGTTRNGTIFRLSFHAGFFHGEVALPGGVYYLTFANSNYFGFYNYTYFPYLYHYNLGFEYFIDANDGANGAYLYDFTSGHFWYTNPQEFPYLYDFNLGATLYYFPDPNNGGQYTDNPRKFYNFGTGQQINQ